MKVASRRVPLELDALGGTAPLRVNSSVLVDGFNADLLDGMSSEDFLMADAKAADADEVDGLQASDLVRGAFVSTDNALENWSAASLTSPTSEAVLVDAFIDAPVDGMLQISGGAAASYTGGAFSNAKSFTCSIRVSDDDVSGTARPVEVGDGSSSSCQSSGAYFVNEGTQTVELVASKTNSIGLGGTLTFADASLQILFIPFAANGDQICVSAPTEPLCPIVIDPSLVIP